VKCQSCKEETNVTHSAHDEHGKWQEDLCPACMVKARNEHVYMDNAYRPHARSHHKQVSAE
jgi:hypothetical protein